MDWKQIEKDFKGDANIYDRIILTEWQEEVIVAWFKTRIESELPPQPPEKLNEEERNEFHNRTDVTADIKAVYERKT